MVYSMCIVTDNRFYSIVLFLGFILKVSRSPVCELIDSTNYENEMTDPIDARFEIQLEGVIDATNQLDQSSDDWNMDMADGMESGTGVGLIKRLSI